MKFGRLLAAALAVLGVASPVVAQDYPTRTISLVVPYPPGGGVDAMARVVAEKLSGAIGQQVVVDNRAGGSGLVGTRAAAKSAPDGYTLFLGHTGSLSINPSLYANAGFDPRKVFSGENHWRRHRHCQEGGRQAQHRHLGSRHRRLSVG
jgi:tripartite-type tricarboxylate transporter receptor subunit TctC